MKIDFDASDRDFNLEERVAFWEGMRPWFSERGYTLYRYNYESNGEPLDHAAFVSPQSVFEGKIQHPYSFFGGEPKGLYDPSLINGINGRVVCAQDDQHRHVAIKLVKDDSDEYKILRVLSQESSLLSFESFGCVVPPIDFLQFDRHWFVVMPRWGDVVLQPWFATVREALHFMRCLLKGLCLLHKNHIAHRDIKPSNILVNHFGDYQYYRENAMRKSLRRQGSLVYALFDFDCSVIFPSTTTHVERRLPASGSFIGGCNHAFDTYQGELDYDPFAFDVCALGMLLSEQLQQLTPLAPMLAPLLDGMIARDVTKRFTADKALLFFEGLYPSLTTLQLSSVPPTRVYVRPEEYDRWAALPDDFVRTWSKYRLPKLPWTTRLLRWICDHQYGEAAVQSIRRVLRRLTRVACLI